MDKKYILQEIRHTAQENGGTPLGVQRFSRAERAERKGSGFFVALEVGVWREPSSNPSIDE